MTTTQQRPKAPPPIRRFNPQRAKLKRYLERRWTEGLIPVGAADIRDAVGMSNGEWAIQRKEVLRWMSLLGWKECQRKIYADQPARKGFWPPLRPVPLVDDWSEYDD